MCYKWAWVVAVACFFTNTVQAENISGGKQERVPFQPVHGQFIFGCPTKDDLYDVLDNGIYAVPDQNVCSFFDGATVATLTHVAIAIVPYGDWSGLGGTFVADLYELKVDMYRVYGAWPLDLDEHFFTDPPIIRNGLVEGVQYELWEPPRSKPVTSKVMIAENE